MKAIGLALGLFLVLGCGHGHYRRADVRKVRRDGRQAYVLQSNNGDWWWYSTLDDLEINEGRLPPGGRWSRGPEPEKEEIEEEEEVDITDETELEGGPNFDEVGTEESFDSGSDAGDAGDAGDGGGDGGGGDGGGD